MVMNVQVKNNLIIVLTVFLLATAVLSANGFQSPAPKRGIIYIGISEKYPTGSPAILRDRLVAAYDMRTLTRDGKLRDFSGNNNHGDIHQTSIVKGLFGMARQFSTVSDYIHLPENPTFAIDGPLSIAMWVRVHRLGLHQHMLACDDKFAFWITPDNNLRFVDTLGDGFQSVGGIAIDTWYSIVGVFKGRAGDPLTAENITVFINAIPAQGTAIGRPRNGSNNKLWSPGVLYGKDACYIGFESHQGDSMHQRLQFEGEIDELLIFSRALTLPEVEAFARRNQEQTNKQEK
jgi:hypothetical protein